MKRAVTILLILLGMLFPVQTWSQSGGRKSEKGQRTGKRRGNFVLNQYKSRGHADEFARGNTNRRGRLARLFRKPRPAWNYKSSGSSRSQFKANKYLFTRDRTPGKNLNEQELQSSNAARNAKRERGNKVFKFKKYRRR